MSGKAKIITFSIDIEDMFDDKELSVIKNRVSEYEMGFILFHNNNRGLSSEEYKMLTQRFCEIAKDAETGIVTGSIYLEEENGTMETALYISEIGKIEGTVSKEYDECQLETAKEFDIYDTKVGKIGIVLGKDLWNIEIPRIMALKGAELLFVPDVKVLEKECDEEHIKGISIFNSVYIFYGIQEADGVKLVYVSPENELVNRKMDFSEEEVCQIDCAVISAIREPDYTFRSTMWWLLWGRKPENYKDILENYSGNEMK